MSGPANTQFSLGVHMATLLAALGPAPQPSDRLAVSAESNPVHVRRVLGRLRGAGIVNSQPGPKGGWSLAADPTTITLADIWRAVHGDAGILGIPETRLACGVGDRVRETLLDIDSSAAAAVQRELAGTTLVDLARGAQAEQFIATPAA